ncbi:HNH endonuclease signature motif containing protein, partial [Enterobacter asburiae]
AAPSAKGDDKFITTDYLQQCHLMKLATGKVPSGWQVHHKIPLDDGGTNAIDNLVLIQNSPYHSALSKAQSIITKDLPYNSSTKVLWPSPNGVIYPVGK